MHRQQATRIAASALGLMIALGCRRDGPTAIAQQPSAAAQAADVVFPAGSRIGLVPPPGLSKSNAFQGFEDAEHNVAMIIAAVPREAR